MAEGLPRELASDRVVVASAGTEARGVNPLAVRAMAEVGIDITQQTSKTLERFLDDRRDYVVTVCDTANEACSFLPGAGARVHWSFDDPSAAGGSQEERLAVFQRVRDEIRRQIVAWLKHGAIPRGRYRHHVPGPRSAESQPPHCRRRSRHH